MKFLIGALNFPERYHNQFKAILLLLVFVADVIGIGF